MANFTTWPHSGQSHARQIPAIRERGKNSNLGTLCCYSQALVQAVKYFDKEAKTTQLQILHRYISDFQKEAELNRDNSYDLSSTYWERIKLCRVTVHSDSSGTWKGIQRLALQDSQEGNNVILRQQII